MIKVSKNSKVRCTCRKTLYLQWKNQIKTCPHCRSSPKQTNPIKLPITQGAEVIICKAALNFKACFSDKTLFVKDGYVSSSCNQRKSTPKSQDRLYPFESWKFSNGMECLMKKLNFTKVTKHFTKPSSSSEPKKPQKGRIGKQPNKLFQTSLSSLLNWHLEKTFWHR